MSDKELKRPDLPKPPALNQRENAGAQPTEQQGETFHPNVTQFQREFGAHNLERKSGWKGSGDSTQRPERQEDEV